MSKAWKPTSFRFPPEVIHKIEKLAAQKQLEYKLNKRITKSDILSILIEEAYNKSLNKLQK